jgi:hypothetical protein
MLLFVKPVIASTQMRVLLHAMTRDPNIEDDMFRVQATKEVWFMNRDLQ